MNEMQNFDNAASKFYKKLGINTLPLLSWDISGSHYQKVCGFYNDLADFSALAENNKWETTKDIENALMKEGQIVLVTDADLNIVKASHNIFGMNGYSQEEVVGLKPNIFQGPETCTQTKSYISKAIQEKKSFEATLVNYRKDGSPYKCWIKGEPVFNTRGKVVNFIAYEREVA
ncbi:MAG: PAS domain-containing protein [Eudoraea sp.]|nr:PAS domain-containing protein [Eudoraea sp.]NNJ39716.1 PAS domain-containing protein [Eudoraea sp.]